jgi:hypothetical protein
MGRADPAVASCFFRQLVEYTEYVVFAWSARDIASQAAAQSVMASLFEVAADAGASKESAPTTATRIMRINSSHLEA